MFILVLKEQSEKTNKALYECRLIGIMLPSGDNTHDYFISTVYPPHHGNYTYYIITVSNIQSR